MSADVLDELRGFLDESVPRFRKQQARNQSCWRKLAAWIQGERSATWGGVLAVAGTPLTDPTSPAYGIALRETTWMMMRRSSACRVQRANHPARSRIAVSIWSPRGSSSWIRVVTGSDTPWSSPCGGSAMAEGIVAA